MPKGTHRPTHHVGSLLRQFYDLKTKKTALLRIPFSPLFVVSVVFLTKFCISFFLSYEHFSGYMTRQTCCLQNSLPVICSFRCLFYLRKNQIQNINLKCCNKLGLLLIVIIVSVVNMRQKTLFGSNENHDKNLRENIGHQLIFDGKLSFGLFFLCLLAIFVSHFRIYDSYI